MLIVYNAYAAPLSGLTSSPARAQLHRGSAEPANRRFGAAVVLLVGAAGDRERATIFERDGTATGRQLAAAGHDQALEPGLTGYAAQLLRRLLEAGGGVCLVRRDI